MVAEDSILPASRPVVRLLGWMGPHKNLEKEPSFFIPQYLTGDGRYSGWYTFNQNPI